MWCSKRFYSESNNKNVFFLKKSLTGKNYWMGKPQTGNWCDIIINATSLGLKNGEDFKFNFETEGKNVVFIDTIYNPLETKTLKNLKERLQSF